MNILLLIIFFEIILMKKNNGTLNSDLKNLDMKKIFNGFNCWDTIYLSCLIISIRYFDTFPVVETTGNVSKYDKLRFQEIAPKFVISRNEKSPQVARQ